MLIMVIIIIIRRRMIMIIMMMVIIQLMTITTMTQNSEIRFSLHLLRGLSSTRTLKRSGPSRVQITCNTEGAYHVQHATFHVARRDSSRKKFGRINSSHPGVNSETYQLECLMCMCFVFLYLHLFSAIEDVSRGKAL